MKFTINKDNIKNIIRTINKVSTVSIGGVINDSVLLKTKGDNLNIVFNGISIFLSFDEKIEKGKDGEIACSGQILEVILNSLVDNDVNFLVEDNVLIVKTKSSESKITLLNKDDFNFLIPTPDGIENEITIEREVVLDGIRTVIHAASESTVKPEISSIFIYSKDETLYFVATDSFRLAEVRSNFNGMKKDFSILIPIKNIQKIVRIFDSISDSSITMSIAENGVFFKNKNFLIHTRYISGNFPDYKKIIPRDSLCKFIVLKSDLVNFLKKARFFKNNLNKISFENLTDKTITLVFDNEKGSSTRDIIPISDKSGNIQKMPSFNYKHLNDVILNLKDEQVVFNMNEGLSPVLIRGLNNSTFSAIISQLLKEN